MTLPSARGRILPTMSQEPTLIVPLLGDSYEERQIRAEAIRQTWRENQEQAHEDQAALHAETRRIAAIPINEASKIAAKWPKSRVEMRRREIVAAAGTMVTELVQRARSSIGTSRRQGRRATTASAAHGPPGRPAPDEPRPRRSRLVRLLRAVRRRP